MTVHEVSLRRYSVDWSDPAFPQIVLAADADATGYHSLEEAKSEIITHFRHEIEHARAQIAHVRAVRASDLRRAA